MSGVVTIRGTVRDGSIGAPIEAGRICLTRGDDAVARSGIAADGAFELVAGHLPDGGYQALVLAHGLGGWRRTLEVAGAAMDLDLGDLVLRSSEHPAGIRGQAWDVLADRPVLGGRMALLRGDERLDSTPLDLDGWFVFDLTCRRPLPPGRYALVPDARGYADGPTPLVVTESVTVYQLGRVDLWPAEADAAP